LGIQSIGSHNPPTANSLSICENGFLSNARDPDSPPSAYTDLLGVFLQHLMKEQAANTNSAPFREIGLRRSFWPDELDSTKASGFVSREADIQCTQSVETIRHESFTTCFVDGGASTIRDNHVEALLARGNRRGESCRTSTDDEYVS
jgi:hypothetical protein